MSESPDTNTEAFEDELPATLPIEAPEADVIEQARDVRADPDVAGGLRVPASPIGEADEADLQEQSEVVSYDEDEETR